MFADARWLKHIPRYTQVFREEFSQSHLFHFPEGRRGNIFESRLYPKLTMNIYREIFILHTLTRNKVLHEARRSWSSSKIA
jgi:hypothetical protein